MMMMKQTNLILALMVALLSSASAFVSTQPSVSKSSFVGSTPLPHSSTTSATSSSSSSQLSMALEGKSPFLRKSVMSATVTTFAMPALLGFLPQVVTAVAGTAGWLKFANVHNGWFVAALFGAHYLATDYFLQQYADVGEAADESGKVVKR